MTGPVDGATPRHAWEQLWKWWVVLLIAAIAVTALAFMFDGEVTALERVVGLVLLALLGAAYRWIGFPAMKAERERMSVLYIVLATAIQAGLLIMTPAAFVLLFGLFPQCYAGFRRLRWSITAAMTLTILAGVAGWGWSDWRRDAIPAVLVQTGFSAAFGIFFGTWITKIIDQSTQRATLIAELEQTRGELAVAQRQAGTQAERERLAAEIHDTLAQGFTSIVLLAQAAGVDENRRLDHLAAIESTARENLAEARALVADLSPVALQDASLVEAIQRVTSAFMADSGVHAEVVVRGIPRPLPADHEVVMLRATQETLTSVRKHARATRVDVAVNYADEITLLVRDDGGGFEPDALHAGFGLGGLRRRVAQIGGAVEITSSPGRGTSVTVELP